MNLASVQTMRRGASLLALACVLSSAVAAEPLPASLAPPAGSVEVGRYPAHGTQNYVCARKNGSLAWTFVAPEADLTTSAGTTFAHHFAGPTWQAGDGSKVVGKLVASVPSPTFGAVAWLLLSADATGDGALSGIRFVQRLDTVGGGAPKGACSSPGLSRRVAYRATYVFFR